MEVPRHWRLKKQRYSLMGETCPHCKSHLFPPREVCPVCRNGADQAVLVAHNAPAITAVEAYQPASR